MVSPPADRRDVRHLPSLLVALFVLVPPAMAAGQPARVEEPSPEALRRQVLAAEDARGASPAGLAPILAAAKSQDTETRRVAVRALGRFERAELVQAIAPMLLDSSSSVRSEAANALAQTAMAGGDLATIRDLLFDRVANDSHPLVRGAVAESIGRLPFKTAEDVRAAERLIVAIMQAAPPPAGQARRPARGTPEEKVKFASPGTLLSALRGLEALARQTATIAPLEPATLTLAAELSGAWRSAIARAEGGPTVEAAARLRRLAMAVLVAQRAADPAVVSAASGDADDQVRRLAAQLAAITEPLDVKLVERAVRDRAPMVRIEILRALARRGHEGTCGYASVLLRDPAPHVALTAIETAGTACAGNAATTAAVAAVAGRLVGGSGQTTWHHAAQAIVALARLSPAQAREAIVPFVGHETWQVRMHAARAAAIATLGDVLERLAADEHHNVREAALTGLREVRGHEADGHYLAALGRDDPQLILTAARSLEGTARREEAAQAALAALDRVTAWKRETSRDVRRALLDRVAELGDATLADRVRPYLRDFDPQVARQAASILGGWTGQPQTASPHPLPREPLPTDEEIARLSTERAVVTMKGGATFEIRLLGGEAPLNAWRFLRLASRRYYDGLSFHRVVPNFVIQGGSPGANEYAGDGPFSRDERGLQSNLRGTVGVSTRGLDTGDAQFYVNLVDNVRLDHAFTVFGVVERGLDVVDGILEGDVIERIEIVKAKGE
jgi:cyclophilin family peptidyl-prolyl cis-trans isomerase/HEAT repeat protein